MKGRHCTSRAVPVEGSHKSVTTNEAALQRELDAGLAADSWLIIQDRVPDADGDDNADDDDSEA